MLLLLGFLSTPTNNRPAHRQAAGSAAGAALQTAAVGLQVGRAGIVSCTAAVDGAAAAAAFIDAAFAKVVVWAAAWSVADRLVLHNSCC